MKSERACVAGQGQDRPDADQTVVVLSTPGEENGNRELAGFHATETDRVIACRVIQVFARIPSATVISSSIAKNRNTPGISLVIALIRSSVAASADRQRRSPGHNRDAAP